MTVINTNVAANITANALTKNERAMSQAMERLSTGQRINNAGDDAAGLAVSSRMTSQIKGLNMAVRNANDAISMVQTADGAYIEATNMMQRMRELAVQSATGTMGTTDRAALDVEYQALSAQIRDIAGNTQWNGINLLDATMSASGYTAGSSATFHVGANADQTVSTSFGSLGSNNRTATAAVTAEAGGDTAAFAEITVSGALQDGDTISMLIDGTHVSILLGTGDAAHLVAGTEAMNAVTVTLETTAAGYSADKTLANVASEVATLSVAAGTAANKFKLQGSAWSANGDTFTVTNLKITRGTTAGLTPTDIQYSDHATAAITALDTAIAAMNSQRATFGASINRLEYTADNLSNVSQNTSASRSRILDADYASETTELARTQIIQQAATAMLSQANQQAQSVLALLK